MDPKARLDVLEKKKISRSSRDSNPGSSRPQHSHYIDYAIPAVFGIRFIDRLTYAYPVEDDNYGT
jgi:hypothetical protein